MVGGQHTASLRQPLFEMRSKGKELLRQVVFKYFLTTSPFEIIFIVHCSSQNTFFSFSSYEGGGGEIGECGEYGRASSGSHQV